jgi:hypothetical protein
LWFLGFYQFPNHRTPQFSIFLLLFLLSYSLLEFDLIIDFVVLILFFSYFISIFLICWWLLHVRYNSISQWICLSMTNVYLKA